MLPFVVGIVRDGDVLLTRELGEIILNDMARSARHSASLLVVISPA
jgi:hypothetical protein